MSKTTQQTTQKTKQARTEPVAAVTTHVARAQQAGGRCTVYEQSTADQLLIVAQAADQVSEETILRVAPPPVPAAGGHTVSLRTMDPSHVCLLDATLSDAADTWGSPDRVTTVNLDSKEFRERLTDLVKDPRVGLRLCEPTIGGQDVARDAALQKAQAALKTAQAALQKLKTSKEAAEKCTYAAHESYLCLRERLRTAGDRPDPAIVEQIEAARKEYHELKEQEEALDRDLDKAGQKEHKWELEVEKYTSDPSTLELTGAYQTHCIHVRAPPGVDTPMPKIPYTHLITCPPKELLDTCNRVKRVTGYVTIGGQADDKVPTISGTGDSGSIELQIPSGWELSCIDPAAAGKNVGATYSLEYLLPYLKVICGNPARKYIDKLTIAFATSKPVCVQAEGPQLKIGFHLAPRVES